jgi:hypothetical protein
MAQPLSGFRSALDVPLMPEKGRGLIKGQRQGANNFQVFGYQRDYF